MNMWIPWIVVAAIGTTSIAEVIELENHRMRVTITGEGPSITVQNRIDGTVFVRGINFGKDRTFVAGVQEIVDHPSFGHGRRQVLKLADGSTANITLYAGLPFVVVQDRITNTSDKEQHIRRRVMAEIDVTPGLHVDQCKAFGTFGLGQIKVEENPGSYNHLVVVDPTTRRGVVTVWLTHERASGLLFYTRVDDLARVTVRQDYGALRLKAGASEPSELLLIGLFDDAREGLEQYAEVAARYYNVKLPPQPTVYCTWYHSGASNETEIKAQTDFAAKQLKPFGFNVIQIDDKWQDGEKRNGPRKVFIRHRADGPYPNGMQPIAEYITGKGLTPGLWFMPFVGTHDDPYFADKQNLFAKKDGKPMDVPWGGTCFDMTHPDAQALTRRRTEIICRDWGYRYLKTDGMWTGLACPHVYINEGAKEDNLGETRLHNPDMTHVEAYRTGIRIVREAAGPETFILGCNLAQNMRTLGATIGYVDSMRIGPDNGASWKGMLKTAFSAANLYFLHRRVWYNDPDPLFVRPKLPLNLARNFVSFVAVTGQLHASSYYYKDLPPQRLDLLKRAMPAHTLTPRPVDLFEQQRPRIWLLEDDRCDGPFYLLGLFNWDEKQPATIAFDTDHLDLPGAPDAEAYIGYEYWTDQFVKIELGQEIELLPGTCKVLALRAMTTRPQRISTSRQITQGVVDVIEESWDNATKTLTGMSQLVAGDRYELRIARPSFGSWKIARLEVAPADDKAGVTIQSVKDERLGWRLRIDSPTSRDVRWTIGFTSQ